MSQVEAARALLAKIKAQASQSSSLPSAFQAASDLTVLFRSEAVSRSLLESCCGGGLAHAKENLSCSLSELIDTCLTAAAAGRADPNAVFCVRALNNAFLSNEAVLCQAFEWSLPALLSLLRSDPSSSAALPSQALQLAILRLWHRMAAMSDRARELERQSSAQLLPAIEAVVQEQMLVLQGSSGAHGAASAAIAAATHSDAEVIIVEACKLLYALTVVPDAVAEEQPFPSEHSAPIAGLLGSLLAVPSATEAAAASGKVQKGQKEGSSLGSGSPTAPQLQVQLHLQVPYHHKFALPVAQVLYGGPSDWLKQFLQVQEPGKEPQGGSAAGAGGASSDKTADEGFVEGAAGKKGEDSTSSPSHTLSLPVTAPLRLLSFAQDVLDCFCLQQEQKWMDIIRGSRGMASSGSSSSSSEGRGGAAAEGGSAASSQSSPSLRPVYAPTGTAAALKESRGGADFSLSDVMAVLHVLKEAAIIGASAGNWQPPSAASSSAAEVTAGGAAGGSGSAGAGSSPASAVILPVDVGITMALLPGYAHRTWGVPLLTSAAARAAWLQQQEQERVDEGAGGAAGASPSSSSAAGASSSASSPPLVVPGLQACLRSLQDDIKIAAEELVWRLTGQSPQGAVEALGFGLAAGLLQRKGAIALGPAAMG